MRNTFDLLPLRFYCVAAAPMHFPVGKVGNILRGSLGKNFKKLACRPECVEARTCPHRAECRYARWFEPSTVEGPSGLHDSPRAFVLRASQLDGASLRAGEKFEVGLNLFAIDALEAFTEALCGLAQVESVEGREWMRIPMEPRSVGKLRVRFVTPTELKGAATPDFAVLFTRIRDRISTLRALYGSGPLEIDFKAMGERAAGIRMTRCELKHIAAERVSRKTGQRHPLGGFVGSAEYEGDLSEFVPYLEIARYTGVGRQTVWGKGEIHCEAF